MTLSMLGSARAILSHRSVRLGMRLAAVLIIVRFVSALAALYGGAFTRFEWWVPISLIVVPWYLAFELNGAERPKKKDLSFLLFTFLLPGLLAILVVLGIFIAHWIPARRILFR